MRLIDINKIDYTEIVECLTTVAITGLDEASCEKMINDFINSQPTIDEKEIIRKTVERIVERLEEARKKSLKLWDGNSRYKGYSKAIKIVKEECGISE